MPRVTVYDMEGKQVGEMELSEQVFGAPVNEPVLHQAIVRQLAARRRGTAATKTRGLVSGGGRKPWRQKGTGRARAGSSRSPLWRHGGTVFGPQPRNYGFSMPRKMRRLALRAALSAKLRDQELIVVDRLDFPEPKTKEMVRVLHNLGVDRKALVVTLENANVQKSARNIPGITPLAANGLNVYDIMAHDKLVMTRDAVARMEEVLG